MYKLKLKNFSQVLINQTNAHKSVSAACVGGLEVVYVLRDVHG